LETIQKKLCLGRGSVSFLRIFKKKLFFSPFKQGYAFVVLLNPRRPINPGNLSGFLHFVAFISDDKNKQQDHCRTASSKRELLPE
jgi:hypothetical protein